MDQDGRDWDEWPLVENHGNDQMMDTYQEGIDNPYQSGDNPQLGVVDEDVDLLRVDNDNQTELEMVDEDMGSLDYRDDNDNDVQMMMMSPSLLPSSKQMICEKCGATGIRHAFYGKSKRFCSLSCSRSFATAQREEGKPSQKSATPATTMTMTTMPLVQLKPLPVKKKSPPKPRPQTNTIPSSYNKQNAVKSFCWSSYLGSTGDIAAPVTHFPHAPLSDVWEHMIVGMKVEVINKDYNSGIFWIAAVIKMAGYKALMRYEGFGADSSKDFWINLCTTDVHPVGWCATSSKPLVPPKCIQHKYADWKDFLVKRLTGSRTLPNGFYNKVMESIQKTSFKNNMLLEVVDKMCVSAMKVAKVDDVIGQRLKLKYINGVEDNDGFWCHTNSALIHPVGWSSTVGHKLHSDAAYASESDNKSATGIYQEEDCIPEMFHKFADPPDGSFEVGMKLEAIDPLNLSTICVATVRKVLKVNYLMIGIDGSTAPFGSDWFCYPASSPSIFPVGFCDINSITLTPPRGYKGEFRWFDYLKATKSIAAPVHLFNKEMPTHSFKPRMKIEAVDLMEPRLICVGSIVQVVGRLLKVHFDGWESAYDQWIDCHSPDIYPVGWCEMVGYHLEGPKNKEMYVPPNLMIKGQRRKTKQQLYKKPRKKRKTQLVKNEDKIIGVGGEWGENNPSADEGVSLCESESPVNHCCTRMEPDVMELVGGAEHKVNTRSDQMDITDHIGTNSQENKPTVFKKDNNNVMLSSERQDIPPPVMSISQAGGPGPDDNKMENKQIKDLLKRNHITTSIIPGTQQRYLSSTDTLNKLSHLLKLSRDKQQSQRVTFHQSQQTHQGAHFHQSQQAHQRSMSHSGTRYIPKIVDDEDSDVGLEQRCDVGPQSQSSLSHPHHVPVPELWQVADVCQFLTINNCGLYCESFSRKNIDGKKFLTLSKEQIVNLTGMKVGPSLKIYDLIQQLKGKTNPNKLSVL